MRDALLQHPLGLAYGNGRLYVADTYNNRIKEIDLSKPVIKTISGDGQPGTTNVPARFNEPAGLSVTSGKLYVADTNNHLIRVIDLERDFAVTTLEIQGLLPPKRPEPNSAPVVPGAKNVAFSTVKVNPSGDRLKMDVQLQLPDDYSLNLQTPMSYIVHVTGGDPILKPAAIGQRVRVTEPADEFQIELALAQKSGSAKLAVSLIYYYCQEHSKALCKIGGVNWTGQVTLTEQASATSVQLKYVKR